MCVGGEDDNGVGAVWISRLRWQPLSPTGIVRYITPLRIRKQDFGPA